MSDIAVFPYFFVISWVARFLDLSLIFSSSAAISSCLAQYLSPARRNVSEEKRSVSPPPPSSASNPYLLARRSDSFFASLDRQPVNDKNSTRDLLLSYRRFLMNTKVHGINDLKQLKEFIQTEDRHFRTFLNHIDQCSEIGVEDITRITEDVCSEIYRSVSDRGLTSEDVMVYMSMRTNRRLLLNAKVCHGLFKKGEVKSASQANAYLWMYSLVCPWILLQWLC